MIVRMSVVVMTVLSCTSCLYANEIRWRGANGGSWNDAANWEGDAVPGDSDTAVFALTADTRVILKSNGAAAKIDATGGRLDLYSGTGRTLTLGGSVPELAVGSHARLRMSGIRLAAGAKVRKTGTGTLVAVGGVASAIDLDSAEGELLLENERGKDVSVTVYDGLWAFDGVSSSGKAVTHSPYAGTDGIHVGHLNGNVVTVTARREPVKINGKFRISGDVLMSGTGSHGFAVVLHNDPRGPLARTKCLSARSVGYAGTSDEGGIRQSFAFGVLNHYSMGSGKVSWGWNGSWAVAEQTTEPFIYTSPCGSSTSDDVHPRAFKLQLDFDQVQKTAVLTLVQDQREIVSGGGPAVTWTKTLTGVDLTTLCEGDTATLAFTTDAGGRNTLATVSNLKVEYFESDQHVKDVVRVVPSESLWTNRCYNASEFTGVAYGSKEGSIHVGANAGNSVSVTARKEKVGVKGKFLISGKVADSGTGAWGWALVLHNDARGCLAHAQPAQNSNLGYAGTDKIVNSYAFRVLNYLSNKGQVGDGRNGAWNTVRTTNPLILTNPYDGSTLTTAKYDFSALFDERAKTLVLTLSQDQGGETVTATETFANVDVPTLVGGEDAWLSLTSDAGGRTTNATIDDFKIEYLAYDDETVVRPFFNSLETSHSHPVIAAEGRDGDFVANLGELTVDGGMLQLGSAPSFVTVVPAEELWSRYVNDTESQKVYGERDGSILVGANAGNSVSVTVRKEKVGVKGRFRVSGKVTDNGNGSMGWTLVLHNDPREAPAHAVHGSGYDLAYSGTDAIVRSYAFRIMNFVNVRGQVGDGRNGVWNALRVTDPLIRTNPYDGTSLVTPARYGFTALFDEHAKTMVLTLTQDQDGETVTATETFEDVDVPTLVGGEDAWLSLTSDAGGRTTNVTIDDFRIDCLVDSDAKTAFTCQGAAMVENEAELRLCNSSFAVSVGDQLLGFKTVRLDGDSAFEVAEGMTAKVRSVYVDGEKVPVGVHTAETCDWVRGSGAVVLCPRGTTVIFR